MEGVEGRVHVWGGCLGGVCEACRRHGLPAAPQQALEHSSGGPAAARTHVPGARPQLDAGLAARVAPQHIGRHSLVGALRLGVGAALAGRRNLRQRGYRWRCGAGSAVACRV